MTLAGRIALAMAVVVVIAMAVVVAAAGPLVRRSYMSALMGALEARVDAVAAEQGRRTTTAREELGRLVRSPRLLAAMASGDGEALGQTACDELRGVMERAGEGAGFAFVSPKDIDVASPGIAPQTRAALRASAAALPADFDGCEVRYTVIGDVPFEVLLAPIVDRVEDERIGTLAFGSPVRLPGTSTLPDGTVLSACMALDGAIVGGDLTDSERNAVREAFFVRGDAEAAFDAGSAPMRAVQRPLVGGGTASLVVLAGLGPLRSAESSLLVRAGAATVVAVLAGAIFAGIFARGLSRPVAAIGNAAGRIERGDYAVRVRAEGTDEISVLGRRFNQMAEGLAQREKYRRVLDAVTDPTVAAELVEGKIDLAGREQSVGILFCDIRGFTSLTESMAPREVIAMLNEHMTLLTDVAYAHGGTVDKFVGDLIMVTFGTPKTAADDAMRMLRCARAMVDARERANASAHRPIAIGIGCAYGPVVAGCMGSARRLDYTVLGERVNLAARLCSKAPPMHVYVDATARASATGCAFAPLPPIEAKGFSHPVEAFDLLSVEEPA